MKVFFCHLKFIQWNSFFNLDFAKNVPPTFLNIQKFIATTGAFKSNDYIVLFLWISLVKIFFFFFIVYYFHKILQGIVEKVPKYQTK